MHNKAYNPATISPQYHNVFSNAVELQQGQRTLFLSGQMGIRENGQAADDIEEQCVLLMENLRTVLRAADMDFEHLVKMNAYFVNLNHIPIFARIRKRYIGDVKPAMLSVVVSALADPTWFLEVDAVAAR